METSTPVDFFQVAEANKAPDGSVFSDKIVRNSYLLLLHQSIPTANIPPGNPRGFAPIFSPGLGDLYHRNCPGVAQGADLLSKYQVVS